ncbi:MAG: protein PhnA [Phenylobacterium sp.]|jgi:protein PhnA
MTIEQTLLQRCDAKCELCTAPDNLSVYEVPPVTDPDSDKAVMLCASCKGQIEDPAIVDMNHWRCLNDSMWSQTPAVQVMAWRMLNRLKAEGWAQDLLDMLYMEDDVRQWAEADAGEDDDNGPTLDSNGAALQAGDNVTLIKDLEVKGAGFTAKRGTMVRNISLTDNPLHIEGRVNGTRIVLVAAYLKKS